jgi:hypothetical protein
MTVHLSKAGLRQLQRLVRREQQQTLFDPRLGTFEE